jgi:hypothetical protein
MQRTEILALVAGAFVGLWGGMLGAFLVSMGRWEAWYRFLNHAENKQHTLLQDERM